MARWTQFNLDMYNAKKGVLPPATKAEKNEGVIHNGIIEFCDAKGWKYSHARMDKKSPLVIGTPDFIIALDGGVTLWLEVKNGSNKPSPEQRAWIAGLKRLGHHAAVVNSYTGFLMEVWKTQRNQ